MLIYVSNCHQSEDLSVAWEAIEKKVILQIICKLNIYKVMKIEYSK